MKMIEKIEIIERKVLSDERGDFFKVITGNEFSNRLDELEVYFTSAKPGFSKGGHYHKLAQEWFTLVRGKCTLILKDIKNGSTQRISLTSDKIQTVFVPSMVAHEFVNDGDEDFLLMAFTDQSYRAVDTIQYKLNP